MQDNLNRILVEQRLMKRALEERQRKRKSEIDNLLQGCRDKQDDFERHLGTLY